MPDLFARFINECCEVHEYEQGHFRVTGVTLSAEFIDRCQDQVAKDEAQLPLIYVVQHCPNTDGVHWHRSDKKGRVISGAQFTCYLEAKSTFKNISRDVIVVEAPKSKDD